MHANIVIEVGADTNADTHAEQTQNRGSTDVQRDRYRCGCGCRWDAATDLDRYN